MSAPVVAVATSPAIDRISLVPAGPLEGVVRASQALETPGGKAVHAAMVAGGARGRRPCGRSRRWAERASCCVTC